ncbi:MAG: T9SS type A sorting domain-containing protein, partial [Bacteroidia bacterium]
FLHILAFLFICIILSSSAFGQSVNLPTSGSVSNACGSAVTVYDDGGSGSNYSNSASGYIVLNAGGSAVINISGSYVTENGFDYVYIYSGSGTGGTLLQSYTGSGTINYTGTAGQTLTIQLSSDGSVNYSGIALNVTYSGTCPSTINIPASGSNTVTCGTSETVYLNNGAAAYSNSDNGYTVFSCSGSGQISISGSYVTESGFDYVYIYLGSGTGGSQIAGSPFTGSGSISYTAAVGQAITIQFTSDGSVNYAGTAINVNYLATCCTPPTTQASNLTFSAITCGGTNITANWTRGNGNDVMVVCTAGGASTGPTSGTAYTANTTFGSGTACGGGYCVYNGTGTSVNVTGLTAGTTYYFDVYEYATAGTCYKTPALESFTVIATGTPCSGTPNAGSAYPSVAAGCSAYSSVISLSGGNIAGECGLSYQWYSSPNNSTWTSLGAGATSSSYTAAVSATTYYQCIATCSNGGLSGTSVSTYCQEGPAANDACTTPVVAGVVTPSLPYSVYSNNLCATLNTGMADPAASCGGVGVGTLWYTFTTPSYASNYTVSVVPATMTFAGVAVYSGACGGFTQVGCSYPGTASGIPVVSLTCLPANTTYYVMVYCNSTAGDFFLNITSPACGGGNTEATVVNQCAAGAYASTMSLINVTGCVTGYQWQTSTDNATWSNVVGATASTYAATISSNIYYHCVVTCSGGSTSASQSVFCNAPGSPPANDACASAQTLTFYGGINLGDYLSQAQGDNSCATADGTSSCFVANKSVWYKFQAPSTGNYFVAVEGNTMQLPEIALYTGSCGAFTEACCAGGNVYTGINAPFDAIWSYYPYGRSPYSLFGGDYNLEVSPWKYSAASICGVTAGTWVYIMVDDYPGSLKFTAAGNPCSGGGGCNQTTGPGVAGTFTLLVGTLNNDAIPTGVVVNSCGSIFNSSTIGATNCGDGLGDGGNNNLDNNNASYCNGSGTASCGNGAGAAGNAYAANGTSANGGDVGYTVENDSWYQFCVVANSTVTINFQPVASSCIPVGTSGLQIAVFSGTPANLSKIDGGYAGMSITGTWTTVFTLAAGSCVYTEVDGFNGTNCNYQLAITMVPNCVLPVEILSFSGILTEDIRAKLNWVTASEENSDHYLIERSTDGVDYNEVVGTVKAAGHSTKQLAYEIYDNHPAKGTNYYKLTEFDKNGVSNFLGYATVNNRASLPLIHLYPNPAQNSITLSLKNFATPVATYELYDAQGILHSTATIGLIDGEQDYKIDLSNLANGFYYIKVVAGDELLKKTFIKAE